MINQQKPRHLSKPKYYPNTPKIYCKNCNRELYDKRIKTCFACKAQKYKLYTEKKIDSGGYVSEGLTIYNVTPIQPTRNLRCHHVYLGKYIEDGDYTDETLCKYLSLYYPFELEGVTKMSQVWDKCMDYCFEDVMDYNNNEIVKGIDKTTYCEELSKGIISYNGNGIHAVVVDKHGKMFRIVGGWS